MKGATRQRLASSDAMPHGPAWCARVPFNQAFAKSQNSYMITFNTSQFTTARMCIHGVGIAANSLLSHNLSPLCRSATIVINRGETRMRFRCEFLQPSLSL